MAAEGAPGRESVSAPLEGITVVSIEQAVARDRWRDFGSPVGPLRG